MVVEKEERPQQLMFRETVLNMSLKSACFNDETFSVKEQNSWSWEYSVQVLDYQEVKVRVELYLYSPLGLHGLFEGELYLYILIMLCL